MQIPWRDQELNITHTHTHITRFGISLLETFIDIHRSSTTTLILSTARDIRFSRSWPTTPGRQKSSLFVCRASNDGFSDYYRAHRVYNRTFPTDQLLFEIQPVRIENSLEWAESSGWKIVFPRDGVDGSYRFYIENIQTVWSGLVSSTTR